MRPYLPGHRTLSSLSWAFIAAVLIGLDLGLALSPAAAMRESNNPALANLWLFPVYTTTFAAITAALLMAIGLFFAGMSRIVRALSARGRGEM